MSKTQQATAELMALPTMDNAGHPCTREGAPRKRGPRALMSRLRAWQSAPEVRVWASPAFRALGICGVLGCVAFLGKQSENETMYGAQVEVPSGSAGTAPSDGATPAPGDESGASNQGSREPQYFAQTGGAPAPNPCAPSQSAPTKSGVTADGRVIMNEATQQEFTQLRGVGEARAEAIVKLRERMGRFRQVSDLLRVRGIGWKTLQTMKENLVVDRPADEEEKDEEAEGGDSRGGPEASKGDSSGSSPS